MKKLWKDSYKSNNNEFYGKEIKLTKEQARSEEDFSQCSILHL